MIVDLMLLVLISSLFFIFLGTQMTSSSAETAAIRNRNTFTQKLLFSTLSYGVQNGSYTNATIAELIAEYHCGAISYSPEFLNLEINSLMFKLNKPDYYFILHSTSTRGDNYDNTYACSPEVFAVYGSCCVKTEKVNIAVIDFSLLCGGNATVSLGVWPSNMKVESC
jgi:hypothetical protein